MPKSLLDTNRYLRDPEARKTALWVSAASSSAVEGIRRPFATAEQRRANLKGARLSSTG
jgi:hypothetical protein